MLRRLAAAGLLLLVALAVLLPSPPALSQVQDGATMTVLRGQVAVISPDGSAVQPAPSGTVVHAGDEIRTLGETGALITFFVGTEIELGEDTILVVDRVSRQGERVDVSLKQVFGATLHRVQTFTDPTSAYRIEAGGAVAVVRGTTFSLLGPIATANGNVVVLVCLEDCDHRTTFAGVPLASFTGYFVEVDRGRAVGPVRTFSVDPLLWYWQNLWEGATIFEQLEQGDTRGVPAGQVPAGQQAEVREQLEREERERNRNNEQVPGLGTLRGLVRNAVTGQPLPGVRVEVVEAAAGVVDEADDPSAMPVFLKALTLAAPSTVTDGNGRFTLTSVPTGNQVVRFSAPGFQTVTVTRTVTPGDNPDINVSLSPVATAPATVPALSISDVSATDGNSGTTTAVFTVTLSAASSQTVTVDFATANGTAIGGTCGTAGVDYQSTSGTVSIPPGETSGTITVPVCGDALDEPDETFVVELSDPTNATIDDGQGTGTITDDAPAPALAIGDRSIAEGVGTATFTVTLSAPSGRTVTVAYTTANGTATAGADYQAVSGTLTFALGTTTQTISVPIVDDALDEPDEAFVVNLSSPANATISDGQGTGTIVDDDPAPTLSISSDDVTEGTDPCYFAENCSGGETAETVDATFTVTLSAASARTVTVSVDTQDDTANGAASGVDAVPSADDWCLEDGSCDYVDMSTTLTFSPGETSKTVTVQVISDRAGEPCDLANETFVVNLSGETNATIADGEGTGTIDDDDGESWYCSSV